MIEKLFTKLFAFVEIIFVSFSKNCRCERRKAEETKGREGGRWKEHVFERIIEEKISVGVSPPPPPPLSLLLLSNVFGKKFGEEKGLDLTGKGNIYQGTG